MSRAEIGRLVDLSPTQVSFVVANHPDIVAMLRKKGARPAAVAKRYRMELSTALRIARGLSTKAMPRTWRTWE